MRHIHRLQKQLSTHLTRLAGRFVDEEEKTIRKELNKWQLDLDYIDFFPSGTPYVPLFVDPAEKAKRQAERVARGESGSDSEASESESDSESESADGKSGKKKKVQKPYVAKTEEQIETERAALEAKRSEIRKIVAKAKQAHLVKSGMVQPAKKQKYEEKEELFVFEEEEQPQAKATKKEAAAEADEAGNDQGSASEQEEETKPSSTKQTGKHKTPKHDKTQAKQQHNRQANSDHTPDHSTTSKPASQTPKPKRKHTDPQQPHTEPKQPRDHNAASSTKKAKKAKVDS